MILMVHTRTPAWIAEDLGSTWLRALAKLTSALLGANEAFPNCAVEDCESSRVFPAGLVSSAIMSIFVFATATVGLCRLACISTKGD